jgi:hypothetical protein
MALDERGFAGADIGAALSRYPGSRRQRSQIWSTDSKPVPTGRVIR